jgi:hypothetical protein
MTTLNSINNVYPNPPTIPYYLTASITLSVSDLSNLQTVPKLILPAPGSGFANIPVAYRTESSAGTAWSGTTQANYINDDNNSVSASFMQLGLGGTSIMNSNPIAITGSTTSTYARLDNKNIYLIAPLLTGSGTQTTKVWIIYFILPLV